MAPPSQPDILVFGGAHVDRIARSHARLEPGQSNPGHLSRSVGGVAGNVARGLARLEWQVALSTISGADDDAHFLKRELAREGINTDRITINPDKPSASYTAIEDRNGSLNAAIADMDIYDSFPAEQIADCLAGLERPTLILTDTNLSADVLDQLVKGKGEHTLAISAVSGPKANRAGECLSALDLLFCNEEEAAILAQEFADPEALPEILMEEGVKSGIITRGDAGLTAWQGDKVWKLPAPPVKVRSTNGAGDCLCACVLHARLLGRSFGESLAYGMAGANLALMSEQSVPDMLNRQMLEACLAEIPQADKESQTS
ncbi:Sugar or nucleoside kinase, ribokinase family [Cohaesibacter sp. ES.047]|uniref:carbohydrate kinase family protein n=1 Tax=Cohaesibacter sp. ES.047 TaxID=1798205 RepID=UPI000BB81745|nr:carbohydrate kinase family protein [Cohaesibacter sp. ES.047]SNY94250.1 Sugar or nucleoside kinase, ribokinase family [Cohaesibacter sp. ES.047]